MLAAAATWAEESIGAVVQTTGVVRHEEMVEFDRKRLGAEDVALAVGALPVTAGGEIDYLAVPALAAATGVRRDAAEPDEELLASLTSLWRQLLRRPDLDADANFFTVGGQSLIAARLVYQTSGMIGVRIPLDILFNAPTPRRFARELVAMQARQAG